MSESKFTPGPWEFGTFAAGLLIINESIGKHSPVAQVGGSDLRFVDDNDYANARLISAAPEMLEALQALDRIKEIWLPQEAEEGFGEEMFVLHEAYRNMLAAIQKATA